ncbi:MAG: hypothetical protein MZV64_63420 [Ignavibacteriales bacterium]|nr:hypothetical protein [Ignavibacteriales bacterium]
MPRPGLRGLRPESLRRLRARKGEDPAASPSSPRARPTSSGSPSTPARSGRARELGVEIYLEGPAEGGRPGPADHRGRGFHQPRRRRHRPRAPRRPGPRAAGRRTPSGRGIPVVIIDSGLAGRATTRATWPRTTTRAASWPPAGWAELLGGKGRIFLIRYQEGSASTDAAGGRASSTP